MELSKTSSITRSGWLPGAGLLIIVLFFFFWQGFLPGYVQFNNDGPLGALKAASAQFPAAFTGTWASLNSIGSGGAFGLNLTGLISWMLGPVGFAKFFIPITLLILGLGALTFFNALRLTPTAVILGALAAMLNSAFFSTACWGVASQQIGEGMDFFALALVVSVTPAMSPLQRWARIALAGLAVGMNFNEALDIGALFSMCVAAFIVYHAWAVNDASPAAGIMRGVGRVVLVTLCAVFIAAQGLIGTFQTQIKGVVGMQQDAASKAQHWEGATQWSLPKLETLSLFMPGLFGYRLIPMTTTGGAPTRDGSDYWGAIGRDHLWDKYLAEGKQGPAPNGFLRQVGGGNYSGVLVWLVALWAAVQAFRKKDSAFVPVERRLMWFWVGLLVVSLLLAFGRYAPFYQIVYSLPYFSTMRNPTKYLYLLSFAVVILFAYGIHGLSRRYSTPAAAAANNRSKGWWARMNPFDQRWTIGCIAVLVISLIGWWLYAGSRQSLEHYLENVPPSGGSSAEDVAKFSVSQPGWFALYFTAGAVVLILIFSGWLAGRRAKLAGILLGIVLVADLGRADLPWIVYWNYEDKYETNGPNPVVKFLATDPYEQRVAVLPSWLALAFQVPQQVAEAEQFFDNIYQIEWAQHLFLYYNVQSIDVVQMPRLPEDLSAFEGALMPRSQETLYLAARRWELTNTRYLLGAAPWLDVLNQHLDPVQHRFRIRERFNFALKPGVTDYSKLTDVTAVLDTNGPYALYEFTGALPRAKLYSHWQVNTNDHATLAEITSLSFDPHQTVVVANPVPAPPAPVSGTNAESAEFLDYSPKHVALKTTANSATILLLNDRYDPNWQVLVDEKPADLLRCNFIMRGVYLPRGTHTVDFRFKLFIKPLYVSITANVLAVLLIGLVLFSKEKPAATTESSSRPTSPKDSSKK